MLGSKRPLADCQGALVSLGGSIVVLPTSVNFGQLRQRENQIRVIGTESFLFNSLASATQTLSAHSVTSDTSLRALLP